MRQSARIYRQSYETFKNKKMVCLNGIIKYLYYSLSAISICISGGLGTTELQSVLVVVFVRQCIEKDAGAARNTGGGKTNGKESPANSAAARLTFGGNPRVSGGGNTPPINN